MSQSTWRIPFGLGEPVPYFHAPTPQNPRFHLSALGGMYVVLSFIGNPNKSPGSEVLNFVFANRSKFDGTHTAFFPVITEKPNVGKAVPDTQGIVFFLDYEQKITQLYRAVEAGEHKPYTLVLDHMLRVIAAIPMDDAKRHNQLLAATLDRLPRIAEAPANEGLHAPVLILPRVFEPEFCRALIRQYQTHGGEASGYMREVEGKTVPVLNAGFEELRNQINQRISSRLLPQIFKAFQFKATRMERYTIACYSSEEQGFFRAHRDNTTPATKHRRFACTINLNAEDYDGGDLRFPEFGRQTYRAPTGGACIFSCSLLHEATPVTQGDRYAFLPFFYDDEGADIRKANLEHLSSETVIE